MHGLTTKVAPKPSTAAAATVPVFFGVPANRDVIAKDGSLKNPNIERASVANTTPIAASEMGACSTI